MLAHDQENTAKQEKADGKSNLNTHDQEVERREKKKKKRYIRGCGGAMDLVAPCALHRAGRHATLLAVMPVRANLMLRLNMIVPPIFLLLDS